MKRQIKPLATAIAEVIATLIGEKTTAAQMILCPAICSGCGTAWVLRKWSDSQYTRIHACVPGPATTFVSASSLSARRERSEQNLVMSIIGLYNRRAGNLQPTRRTDFESKDPNDRKGVRC